MMTEEIEESRKIRSHIATLISIPVAQPIHGDRHEIRSEAHLELQSEIRIPTVATDFNGILNNLKFMMDHCSRNLFHEVYDKDTIIFLVGSDRIHNEIVDGQLMFRYDDDTKRFNDGPTVHRLGDRSIVIFPTTIHAGSKLSATLSCTFIKSIIEVSHSKVVIGLNLDDERNDIIHDGLTSVGITIIDQMISIKTSYIFNLSKIPLELGHVDVKLRHDIVDDTDYSTIDDDISCLVPRFGGNSYNLVDDLKSYNNSIDFMPIISSGHEFPIIRYLHTKEMNWCDNFRASKSLFQEAECRAYISVLNRIHLRLKEVSNWMEENKTRISTQDYNAICRNLGDLGTKLDLKITTLSESLEAIRNPTVALVSGGGLIGAGYLMGSTITSIGWTGITTAFVIPTAGLAMIGVGTGIIATYASYEIYKGYYANPSREIRSELNSILRKFESVLVWI